jgi:hypothetical protein
VGQQIFEHDAAALGTAFDCAGIGGLNADRHLPRADVDVLVLGRNNYQYQAF